MKIMKQPGTHRKQSNDLPGIRSISVITQISAQPLATTYLAFDHEDYGVGPESGAGSKQPVEVGIVGVADPQVA